MSEEVMAKATELGRAISESPEAQLVRKRQQAMFDNTKTLEMLKTFHGMQDILRQKQESGGEVSPEEQKAMERMELQLHENRLYKEFMEAQQGLQEMLRRAMKIVVQYDKET